MRDSKLYKELGYSDFGDYCEQETGFKRANVYNYINVVERLPEEFVYSSRQIGIKNLLCFPSFLKKNAHKLLKPPTSKPLPSI